MAINNFNICPICGASLRVKISVNHSYVYYVNCPVCGRFAFDEDYFDDYIDRRKHKVGKNEIAAYLYYNNVKLPFPFISSEEADVPINHRRVTLEEIDYWYPKSFSERLNIILLGFAKKTEYFGQIVSIEKNELLSLLLLSRYSNANIKYSAKEFDDQIHLLTDYLVINKYIDFWNLNKSAEFCLLAEGWKRIDTIQKNSDYNKNVFVSMSFSDDTKQTREAIRNGIIDSKFSPKFIDETIHNRQIVPEMFRLIRESRFLILEISDPNYGAYYEAGYALGLGKEVIICCSREMFNKEFVTEEEKKFAKYLKPHFDVAQKQILVWEDYKDLRKKLSEWIKELFN